MTADSKETNALTQFSGAIEKFVHKLTGGAFEQLGGMAADWLRKKRFELAVARIEGTYQKCRDAGFENPDEVSLDVLLPWLEGASVEQDECLHELWESLLANEADPRKQIQTHRSFVRILKQIEAPEQKVLEGLYALSLPKAEELPDDLEREWYELNIDVIFLDNDEIRKAIQSVGFNDDLISEDRLNLAKSNLVRLGLCASRNEQAVNTVSLPAKSDAGTIEPVFLSTSEIPRRICLSQFGLLFYEACQPPGSMKSDTEVAT